MTAQGTPEPSVSRACARVGLARRSKRLRLEHGLDRSDVADVLGCSESAIKKYEHPDRGGWYSLADIEVIGEAFPAFARALMAVTAGELGLRLVDAEQPTAVLDDIAALGRLGSLAGHVMHALSEAYRDGILDGGEADDIEPILAELEAAVASKRARVNEARKARADAVRGPLKAV